MRNESAVSAVADLTPQSVKTRLCAMMFLQYFVQGSYLTIVADFLQKARNFTAAEMGWFMAAMGAGPALAPFVVGQLVDRRLATERVLAACHLLAGLLMLALYNTTAHWPIVALGVAYSILYVPTMMLTNSMAFHHLRDRDREFPLVRVWGTLGFIVPSWFILFYYLKGLEGAALNQAQGVAFAVSGIAGLVMAAYCLTLPHTPPEPRGSGKFAPGVVFGLLGRRDFLVLFVVSFFIAGIHNYYFTWNGTLVKAVLTRGGHADWTQAFTTIGQIAEIGAMALLAPAIARLGYKRTMLLGGAAYALRCAILAAAGGDALPFVAAAALAGLGQALHGFCFALFMAAAFIYVDRMSPADVKGSMQTIYGTLVMGLGMVVGGFWAGQMGEAFSSGSGENKVYEWAPLWLWCAAAAAVCTLALAAMFPDERRREAARA